MNNYSEFQLNLKNKYVYLIEDFKSFISECQSVDSIYLLDVKSNKLIDRLSGMVIIDLFDLFRAYLLLKKISIVDMLNLLDLAKQEKYWI